MLTRDRREISDRMTRLEADLAAGRITERQFVEMTDHWYAERAYAEEAAQVDRIEFAKLRAA